MAVEVLAQNACCGIKEINNIYSLAVEPKYTPELALIDVVKYYVAHKNAFILFSDTERHKYLNGQKLKAFIEQEGLGDVWESPDRVNTNTGNRIRMWVWSVFHDKLIEWATKRGVPPIWNGNMGMQVGRRTPPSQPIQPVPETPVING